MGGPTAARSGSSDSTSSSPRPGAQIHDFHPGVDPSGLFWTTMILFGSVEADASRGTASLIVNDLAVPDYFDIVNALTDHPAVPPIPRGRLVSGGLGRRRRARHLEAAESDFAAPLHQELRDDRMDWRGTYPIPRPPPSARSRRSGSSATVSSSTATAISSEATTGRRCRESTAGHPATRQRPLRRRRSPISTS